MKIAINTLPLKTAHKTRGIGYYTRNLLDGLRKDNTIEVLEFTSPSEVKDVDLVHYPWFDLFFYTLPLRKKFPTIVTIHDVIPLLFSKNYSIGIRGKINFILQKTSLKNCSFIITDSLNSKKDIQKYLNIKDEKITSIPLAADKTFKVLNDTSLLHVKRKYNLPEHFLLYVGDANWIKNLPFLIEGFREVVNKPEFDKVKLVLVGGVFLKNVENINHPELESLKKVNRMIFQYHMENNILRPGNIDGEELVSFYNLATAYIQPSLYEGFGLPILQAFSCGTPVISSNRGSLPEVGGGAAVYFDPTNLNQFETILIDIIKDKSLQNRLSKLGLKQATRFSWGKVIDETKSIYRKIIDR